MVAPWGKSLMVATWETNTGHPSGGPLNGTFLRSTNRARQTNGGILVGKPKPKYALRPTPKFEAEKNRLRTPLTLTGISQQRFNMFV